MTAKLIRFRVRQFRSIPDSGWIDVNDIGTFIGTNESGKTNLLVALWKLKPAKGGQIDLIADLPRKEYHRLRDATPKPTFITADFRLDAATTESIAALAGCSAEEVRVARVTRSFDNQRTVSFPDFPSERSISADRLVGVLDRMVEAVSSAPEMKSEQGLKTQILAAAAEAKASLSSGTVVHLPSVRAVEATLSAVRPSSPLKTSKLVPVFKLALDKVEEVVGELSTDPPGSSEEARETAWDALPPFIYYSSYGNLDSEIYLPHVIQNLSRDDLGEKERAKARTLKVLFDFVNLTPEEILALGKAVDNPTAASVDAAAKRTKEREILLQSASTDLTGRFRNWWRQGDYLFRFQADGNHFRIWVSDDRRPEPIELEARSSGLQWFFSFYLVFLVEAEDSHQDAVLLLDEPGLSLHPVSQKDLSAFFAMLSQSNQVIFNTHSPFMVDPDHLDRVQAVYVESDGSTAVSTDLRGSGDSGGHAPSIYPVHAALGLSVSDALLQGCQLVIVEGPSDQHYLSAVKLMLIREGKLRPNRELVFVPAGGVKGVKATTSILSAKDDELPPVILDGDATGLQFASHLRKDLYSHCTDRVLVVSDFFADVADPEVEDLFPPELWAAEVTKYLRGPEEDFDETLDTSRAVCDQVVDYARRHGLALTPGWKVDVARRVKQHLVKKPDEFSTESSRGRAWHEIFRALTGS